MPTIRIISSIKKKIGDKTYYIGNGLRSIKGSPGKTKIRYKTRIKTELGKTYTLGPNFDIGEYGLLKLRKRREGM